jgi:alpha-tubulin suppressor-like RCC1 family protein
LSGVKAVAAGLSHSLALKEDGTVVGWGQNSYGQLDIPAGLTNVKAISAGQYHGMALKNDGTVVAWGNTLYGLDRVPEGLSGVIAIASGSYHNIVLRADGTVVGWGYDDFLQARSPAGLMGVTAIAAGAYHNVAARADGSVVAWGWNLLGQTNVPAGLSDVIAVASGVEGYHSAALKRDGTVVAWGTSANNRTAVPAGLSGANAISSGGYHGLAARLLPRYVFTGFREPIANKPSVNSGRAGRIYPVKWQLLDRSGETVSSLSIVKSISATPVSCANFGGTTTGTINAETSGSSGLRFDVISNEYIYNWKTPSTPGCYTLSIALDSGEVQEALFNLSK